MIARMTGMLLELDGDGNTVLLEVADIVYEVLVPEYAVSDLSEHVNRAVTLHCLEYLEASGMGGNLTPRLIGFPQAADKAFFRRFTSVKGIGARKALRALARPLADIASSIENGDTKMLTTLPEIGRRMAEQIVAELKGKVSEFATAARGRAHAERRELSAMEREALEILLQLGERRSEAEEWIEQVIQAGEAVTTTDALVQAVYRAKAGTV